MNLETWALKHSITAEAFEDLKTNVLQAAYDVKPTEMGGSEAGGQSRIRLEAPKRSSILWRNNVGMLFDQNGTPVRFGLANESSRVNKMTKSSDLIGITPILYAGRTFGVFTAIECKKSGWRYTGTDREKAQLNYLNIVKSYGGIGAFATCEDDYNAVIDQFVQG